MSAPRRTHFLDRIRKGTPLLITVAAHLVLIAIAAHLIVGERGHAKKHAFEASPADASPKIVEHRLQVARRAGGSAPAVSLPATRIYSTAESAVRLPSLPELPAAAGSLGLGSFGSGAGMTGLGSGFDAGLATTGRGLGRGFMSLSFLGIKASASGKVVVVVDVGRSLLDIRKGGIRAFEIIRGEISRLVGGLPPSAEFNLVFFGGNQIRLYADKLQPATSTHKRAFLAWMQSINSDLNSLGMRSLPADSPRWEYHAADSLALDPLYRPSLWVNALHAALEQQPETVYLITGAYTAGSKETAVDPAEVERRRRERAKRIEELRGEGYDLEAIAAARARALAKLRAEFEAINRELVSRGKDPFVIQDIRRVLAPDFQAALKRAGFSLVLDTTGWTDKQGRPIWTSPAAEAAEPAPSATLAGAEFSAVIAHVSRLQIGLLRERAALNIFLFAGAEENTEAPEKNLSGLATRNNGVFKRLTARTLEQLDAPGG